MMAGAIVSALILVAFAGISGWGLAGKLSGSDEAAKRGSGADYRSLATWRRRRRSSARTRIDRPMVSTR